MDIKVMLRNRRKELGLTMKQVADMVNVSESTISRWESGKISNMTRENISVLAKVLRIRPSSIMGWDEPDGDSFWESVPIDSVSGKLISNDERPFFDEMFKLRITQQNDMVVSCYLSEEQKSILISMIKSWNVERLEMEEF